MPKRKRTVVFQELEAQKILLPVNQEKDKIIDAVRTHQSIILVGETGSGKTTQIPQIINSIPGWEKKTIVITQPRRVAAISLARRVSDEMQCKVGTKVGYTIRFEDVTSPETKIKFATDGMLLREMLSDSKLSRYSVIILDEAHERTLRTDILFGAVKNIMRTRKDVKVIVMSATLNSKSFSSYFDNAPIINIPGRQYPVTTFFAAKKQNDYIDAALTSIFQIHSSEPLGDVLVFLTGQEEIENLEKMINMKASSMPPETKKILVCPIFASLPTSQQTRVFEKTPPDTRKIVLSTNIAETSITISGIRYVIDTGMVKVRGYNSKTGIETLTISPISKASANQRSGRAGREAPGFCYRLYTEQVFKELDEETTPEIMRCNLSSVLLLLKASGIEDVVGFDFMDKPSRNSLVAALEQLYVLEALDDTGSLSSLGKQMSYFPVEPTFAKLLLQSKKLKCTKEAIDIVSMLSIDTIFFSPNDKREEANAAKKTFMSYDGDHITLLNVMREYQTVDGATKWCNENFINPRSMKQVMDIRKQLISFCELQALDPKLSCGEDYDNLLKCILAGFFKNVAVKQQDGSFKTIVSREIVHVHPASVLFQTKQQCVMFSEWVKTTKQYLRNVSAIQPSWLGEVAPHYYARNSMNTIKK